MITRQSVRWIKQAACWGRPRLGPNNGPPSGMIRKRRLMDRCHCYTTDSATSTRPRAEGPILPKPTIIYSDNHILVVNKPSGWHVVPNKPEEVVSSKEGEPQSRNTRTKCLLTQLQENRLGGGSQKHFLKPLHRIDQPCTGVVLFAKTSKAASRISKAWKANKVQKTYLCLIQPHNLESLRCNSISIHDNNSNQHHQWWKLEGYQHKRKKRVDSVRGWSVITTPNDPRQDARPVSIRWRQTQLISNVLLVETNQGARHMIRALLSQVGKCPILGDSRYGFNNKSTITPSSSYRHSVALHARGIVLPDDLTLGTTTQRYFEAPIPNRDNIWRDAHGHQIQEQHIQRALEA
ncbi:RNA pseudouridine synthase [Seminavis robusta]|uniref:RNA pseudouridine synthase n=1 Tax=Seminavis robusta TaxID=568900 RepID=A0A9N8EKC3_9STRA|nr:RNA pseudouridine synthase [Seminavis robusta]|eukprot:Sro1290_g259780.1 RNA pseudouridine synthase (349) ;mRNA; r:13960-15006